MKEAGKIKDSCIVIAGQSPNGASYNDEGVGMEFHQGKKAFGESIIEHSNVWTTEITKIAEPGDILMSVRAPVGPTNITDRRICIGRGLAAIRCNKSTISQYVLYALRNIESQIIGNNGAVFNSINKKQIEELPLPALPLSEQQAIVEYLDSAFAKIDAMKANTEKALDEAKALFQASLKEMFEPKEGWEEKKMSSLYDVRDGTHDSPKYQDKGYPLVTSKNLKGGILDMSNVNFISESDYKAINSRSKVDIGDVLFAMIGTIGNPVYVEEEPNYAIKNMALFKVPREQSGEFLRYYLLNNIILSKMQSEAKGTTQKFVSLGYLRNFLISIPPLSEQQSIVETLDSLKSKVDLLQENYDKITQECDTLKQAILRQVFE